MKLADKLGLRKFYGEVEVKNMDRLLDSSSYPNNKNLLSERAYVMDYVEGGWPSEMQKYITEDTLTDALTKYRKLYDAGYVQVDFQFLVTKKGKVEIFDFGGVVPISKSRTNHWGSWEAIEKNILEELGYIKRPNWGFDTP